MSYNIINDIKIRKWCSMDSYWMTFDEESSLLSWLSEIWMNWHWSSKMTELLVMKCLLELWYNVKKAENRVNTSNCKTPSWKLKTYQPDLECDNYVWEVKWCSWSSTWTAWEKILWTPLKYSEIPKLYNKPLIIVLVWYQEWEGRNWFACWNLIEPNIRGNENFKVILNQINKSDIKYIWFTDLLKELKNN